MNTTTTGVKATLSDKTGKRLLTEERDDETRSLANASELFVKDLNERANTPLKMNPVGYHWQCGFKRTPGSTTTKRRKRSIL